MEIFSFLIIVGLLLSSCTTDEDDVEMAIFKNDTDPNKWHNKQHLWMMYQVKNKKAAWTQTDTFKKDSAQIDAELMQTQNPIFLESSNSEEFETAYSEVEAFENSEYEHEDAVLQDY
jgi:hypothetical protein